jgi:hypothetical protein
MRENGWVPVRAQEQSIRTEARRGFQKHVVRFTRAEHLQSWEKNQVRPEVVLVNSHRREKQQPPFTVKSLVRFTAPSRFHRSTHALRPYPFYLGSSMAVMSRPAFQ